MYQTTSLNLNAHFRVTSLECTEDGVTFSICNEWNDDEVCFHMETVTNFILNVVDDEQLAIIEDMTDAERVDYVHDVYEDDFFHKLIKNNCSMKLMTAKDVIAWDSFNAFADFIDGWVFDAIKRESMVPPWVGSVLGSQKETNYSDLSETKNKDLNILRTNYHRLVDMRAEYMSNLSSMFGNFTTALN
jgi:hypothetical protein